jgi:AcrR family transcriptional regulator
MVSRVSPKVADPAIRTTLIETAARLIATEGPSALTLRRLADDVGTSTMAIYTHFGGMTELRREVRREGFARLAEYLSAVPVTRDPVTDLSLLGWAYFTNAVTNPNLYRAMFMDHPVDDEDRGSGVDTFMLLLHGIERCIDAGRFTTTTDAVELATQIWALSHGLVALHLAEFLSLEQAGESLASAAGNLFVGYGDDAGAATRSIERARKKI